VNDLKSSGFLDNYSMKAKREEVDEEMMNINLFAGKYAIDLIN
jgi:hypothetical protein